jgi:phosphoglycerate dehydrogenase-like enzyme
VRANADLRWVQTMAAGGGADVRRAGLSRAELDRIIFTTSAGVHGGTLSEFALFGLFCGAKGLPGLTAFKAGRQWTGRWPMAQVSEWTVLVAGLGGIGQELAAKLTALGARVIGVSLRGRPVPGVERVYGPGDLVTAAAGADAIVSTLPGTEATNGLIGADVLAALKPGATVVSVGRGTVFDEPALIAALKSGQVGFAALDVFAVEPLPPESELWDLPNVVMTPHTAANSPHEQRRIAELFARNATALLDGRPLANVVDTLHFY